MIIKFGARGDAVVSIQKQLIKLGFKGKDGKALNPDGDFGANTEYAVLQFQKSVGTVSYTHLTLPTILLV